MTLRWNKYCLGVYNNQGGITAILIGTDKYIKITDEDEIEKFKNYYENNLPLDNQDEMVQQLFKEGFVVEDDFDEYETTRKKVYEYLEEEKKEFYLTLYVTNQCNFRCIYCPEEHDAKRLSDEKWEALYKYLTKSIQNGLYKKISISFFGGEPLLEVNKIIDFLTRLKDFCKNYHDIIFEHKITTNAYLLTPDIYRKLSELNVIRIHITVDGFGDTHEIMRPLRNGKKSWDTIINNLKYINSVNENVNVILRTNYNHINIKSLIQFNKWELNNFKNNNIKFQYFPVSGFTTKVDKSLLADNNDRNVQEIIDKIHQHSDEQKDDSTTSYMCFLGLRCNSSKYSAYTINTEGEISKCENIMIPYKETFIGKLSDDGKFIFFDNAKEWQENYETEKCKTCIYYPLCAGRSCPAKKILYPDRTYDCLQYYNDTYDKIIKFIKSI